MATPVSRIVGHCYDIKYQDKAIHWTNRASLQHCYCVRIFDKEFKVAVDSSFLEPSNRIFFRQTLSTEPWVEFLMLDSSLDAGSELSRRPPGTENTDEALCLICIRLTNLIAISTKFHFQLHSGEFNISEQEINLDC